MERDPVKNAESARVSTTYDWDNAVIDVSVPVLDQNGVEIVSEPMQVRVTKDPGDNPKQPPTPFLENRAERTVAYNLLRIMARKFGKIT